MAASLKAFIICDDVSVQPDGKIDILGAGLAYIESPVENKNPTQLFKCDFLTIFLQITDDQQEGIGRLALMRDDSGRRYFFDTMAILHSDPVRPTTLVVRTPDLNFPKRGVYFIEFWYNDTWLVDQRLEVV